MTSVIYNFTMEQSNIYSRLRNISYFTYEIFKKSTEVLAIALLVVYYTIFVFFVIITLSAHHLQYSIQSFKINGKPMELSEVSHIQLKVELAESELNDLRYDLSDIDYNARTLIRERSSFGDQNIINNEGESNINLRLNILNSRRDDILERLREKEAELNSAFTINGQKTDVGIADFIWARSFLSGVESRGTFSEIIPDFTSMPPDLLVLILVLLMGALGGTIHLTRKYFYDKKQYYNKDNDFIIEAGYYLFRPVLGAVTALCVYILAKAGVLIISTPASPTSGASLSPFFVSFIGIVSGLLAEQALDTIQKTGSSWFAPSVAIGRERWTLGFEDALNSSGTSKSELANMLGVSPETIDQWAGGASSIPVQAQQIIAAWLRKPARELFSDIPPGNREVENEDSE